MPSPLERENPSRGMQLLESINVDQSRLSDFHLDAGHIMTINQKARANVTLEILNEILQPFATARTT
ncbi:hypothetical protein [Rhizobium bangladeshense]|uniref:hypothetical protein n=2 Tax=Rhizobium bangladeshense TaxID=1138189 RepID=UPI00287FC21D|nr:hypothetical protein [Rhizobium bangladeshense]